MVAWRYPTSKRSGESRAADHDFNRYLANLAACAIASAVAVNAHIVSAVTGDFCRTWDPLRLPRALRRIGSIRERPTNLRLNVRFYQLTNLTWTAWGADGAEGSGSEFTQTDCDPSCTEGTHYRIPVRIHAFNPQPPQSDSGCPADVADVLFYSEIVLTYLPTTAASAPRNPRERTSRKPRTIGCQQFTTGTGCLIAIRFIPRPLPRENRNLQPSRDSHRNAFAPEGGANCRMLQDFSWLASRSARATVVRLGFAAGDTGNTELSHA